MLSKIFLQVVDLSIVVSYVIGVILIIRLILNKAPKKYSYLLWFIVLFRLVMPITIESPFSIIPTSSNQVVNVVKEPTLKPSNPVINTNTNENTIPSINNSEVIQNTTPVVQEKETFSLISSLNLLIKYVWILGIFIILGTSIYSLVQLQLKLRQSTLIKENIYVSKNITSPFVLGFIRPKIYLPETITKEEEQYILLHEQTHIKRMDPLTKIVFFIVATIHWFNPMVWIAYILFSKDMELSCDEYVIKKMGPTIKKEYSYSLLNLSTHHRLISATPLAFGENNTKSRIKNVLNYRLPSFWVVLTSILVVIISSVLLITNPITKKERKDSENITAELDLKSLYSNRTKYVGDNSKVAGIINELPLPKHLIFKGMELATTNKPYGITINIEDDALLDNFDETYKPTFDLYAAIIFSLVENVDEITYNVNYSGYSTHNYRYERTWADSLYDKPILFLRDTEKRFKSLVNDLPERIVQRAKYAPITDIQIGDADAGLFHTDKNQVILNYKSVEAVVSEQYYDSSLEGFGYQLIDLNKGLIGVFSKDPGHGTPNVSISVYKYNDEQLKLVWSSSLDTQLVGIEGRTLQLEIPNQKIKTSLILNDQEYQDLNEYLKSNGIKIDSTFINDNKDNILINPMDYELKDIDQDGANELLVLNQLESKSHAVDVKGFAGIIYEIDSNQLKVKEFVFDRDTNGKFPFNDFKLVY